VDWKEVNFWLKLENVLGYFGGPDYRLFCHSLFVGCHSILKKNYFYFAKMFYFDFYIFLNNFFSSSKLTKNCYRLSQNVFI